MPRFRLSEEIDRPPDQVWDYMVNMDFAYQWMKGVTSVKKISQGTPRCGTKYRCRRETRIRISETEFLVSVWQPKRRYALTTEDYKILATYTYSIEPNGNGNSKVVLDADCTIKGFTKIISPLLGLMIKKHDQEKLTLLKHALES